MNHIQESDWKPFKDLHGLALERFCERILADISRAASNSSKTFYDRYLDINFLLQDQKSQFANAFSNPRRSAAMMQLIQMRRLGLLTDQELSRFSKDTQERVAAVVGNGDA
ncbi:MAG: peptide ABC transporter substrate-binding protein [Elusimicrobia bacterium]|nr:peptide ABC transporter substrate-binding protein [Elusimicrobiota bacterium]